MSERQPITPKQRFKILQRDDFKCVYCGSSGQDDVKLEIDHIKPVAEGGGNDSINLVTSCRDCNIGKGKNLLEEAHVIYAQKNEIKKRYKLALNQESIDSLLAKREEFLQFESQNLIVLVNHLNSIIYPKTINKVDVEKSIKPLFEKFKNDNILKAIEIAQNKYSPSKQTDEFIKSIYGICNTISMPIVKQKMSHLINSFVKRFGNEKIDLVKSMVELHVKNCEKRALSSEEIVEDLEFIRKKVWESENSEHWMRLSKPIVLQRHQACLQKIQENI